MKKIRRFTVLLLLCACLVPVFTVNASEIQNPIEPPNTITNNVDSSQTDRYETTSPWLSGNEDSTIYSNPLDGGNGSSSQITPDTPGKVEKYISELLRNIASSIIGLLNDYLGASLDSIVYGRVGSGHPNRVNIFSFELRKGNPYGVTGAVAYSVLRSMAYIFMALQFIYLLAKASFSGYTSKSREELKNTFYTLILNFCLLALMPFFLDIVLYIRDVILYGLKEVTSQLITGGGTFNLSDAFYMVSENSGTFVDAVMYLGTVLLTIYFVCIYVSVAMDMLICFVIFPITCVLGKQNKSSLETWLMCMLSDICTPVIDAVLLLVPLLTSVMLSDVVSGVRIIQLIMCMLIIPMRGQVKEKLGLSRGGERNGMFGAMAGFTLGRMIGSKIMSGVGRLKDAYGDLQKSRQHGEMAQIDQEEEESLVSDYNSQNGYSTDAAAVDSGSSDVSSEEKTDSSMDSGEPLAGDTEDMDTDMETDSMSSAAPVTDNTDYMEDGTEDEPDVSDRVIPQTREDVAKDLQNSIEAKENEIADMRVEKAAYQQKEKEQRLAMLDAEAGSEPYKQAQKNAAEYALKASESEKKIQKANKQLAQLKGQAAAISGSRAGSSAGTMSEFDARRAEVLAKHANICNFEQPEFRGVLSNEKLKELYRARAIQSGVQTVAGAAGAVSGGVLLASMGSFMPPSTSLMMAAGGVAMGSAVAEAGVGIASGGIRLLSRVKLPEDGQGAAGGGEVIIDTVPGNGTGSPTEQPVTVQITPEGGVAETGSHTEGVRVDVVTENTPGTGGGMKVDAVVHVEEDNAVPQPEITVDVEAIQREAARVMHKMVSRDGGVHNNQVIRALKEANLQVESHFAALDEETRAGITQAETQAYRIEVQTEKIVETMLNRMTAGGKFEKGSAEYKHAREFLQEKVRRIVEEKNQSLL